MTLHDYHRNGPYLASPTPRDYSGASSSSLRATHELIEHAIANGMPTCGPLLDTFGRIHTDLRISLTDRCNLRCTYCMPAEGLKWIPNPRLLQLEEITRLMHIGVTQLGINAIRFTGGEPLLARHLEQVIERAAQLSPRPEIALTTNGLGLVQRSAKLVTAGLDRINVSLDTIDRQLFAELTRRDRFDDVIAGLAAAQQAGLNPVKVNCVLAPQITADDVINLLRFCLIQGYQLRVIEMMPLDADHRWQRHAGMHANEVIEAVSKHFTLHPDPSPRGSSPAELWIVEGNTEIPEGKFGVIASVSRLFCHTCDRTRLTADGKIRNCLFSLEETDLLTMMRSGEGDKALEYAWRAAMWGKKAGHGINNPGFVQPERTMSAIGG